MAEGHSSPEGSTLRRSADALFNASSDDRGTLQALARDLDEAHATG